MGKMKRKHFIIMAVILSFLLSFSLAEAITSKAASSQCTTYDGDNIEDQNYSVYASTIDSYLTLCDDGSIMRFQAGAAVNSYLVEYYDTSYNLTKTVIVSQELPIFGAFYATDSNYYVLSGQSNLDESGSVQVFRITKYDKNWKRIASCGLNGANTTIPFDAGSARMTHSGKYLLIRTSHEMYQSSDGYNHQANVTIQVDMTTMTVTDSYYTVMNCNYGYISHSFNQFIKTEGNSIVAVDHGDAHPRSIALLKYQTDFSTGKFTPSYSTPCIVTDLVEIPGETGDNYTGVSIGGFEISSQAYIVAGNKDINSTNHSAGRDIFVVAKNKSTGTISMNYITNYAEGSSISESATTPHLICISENSYMLLWNKGGVTYYTMIDKYGSKEGNTYSIEGDLSDCVPIVADDKVIWYTWKNGTITFYEIDATNISVCHKHVIENGHKYIDSQPDSNGIVTRTCSECDHVQKMAVPTGYTVWWRRSNGYYYSSISDRYDSHSTLPFFTRSIMPDITDSSIVSNEEMEFISSDESVVKVNMTGSTGGTLIFGNAGFATITVRPKYNKALEKKYVFRVGTQGELDLSKCSITVDTEGYAYTGNAQTPDPVITYNGYTLVKDTDYTLSGSNNTEIGTATLTIIGKGIFDGTINKSFTIKEAGIADYNIVLNKEEFEYCGWEINPTVTLMNKGGAIVDSSLYSIEYSDNVEVGTAKVTITGSGDISGSIDKEFSILPCNLDECFISLYSGESYTTYSGTEKKALYWTFNKDGKGIYTRYLNIVYTNNINAGTATVTVTPKEGDNHFYGSVSKSWTINPLDISSFTVNHRQASYEYTGDLIIPNISVESSSHTVDLAECDIEYANNKDVGEASFTITGKGNYSGSIEGTFTITKRNINNCTVELGQNEYVYDGNVKEPSVTVYNNDKEVAKDQYTVSYSNNTNAGIAQVTIYGLGNFEGTTTKTFEIKPANIKDSTIALTITEYVYDGMEITPKPSVTIGTYRLIEDTDYTLSYSDNVNAGTATATVNGKGNYTGTKSSQYTIKPYRIAEEDITITGEYVYDGTDKKATAVVTVGDKLLALNDDYTLSYSDNINAGKGSVTITCVGNYSGTYTKKFTIEPADISICTIALSSYKYMYDETAKTPSVSIAYGKTILTEGIDYSVAYSDNINIGTAKVEITGKGNYTGTAIESFKIDKYDFSEFEVELEEDIYVYDGSSKEPEAVVFLGDKILTRDKDYTVEYTNCIDVGTATAIFKGIGSFDGEIRVDYEIKPLDISTDTNIGIKLDNNTYVYDGKDIEPSVTLTYKEKPLIEGIDYTISYSGNNTIGIAKITITGKGNYTGSIISKFTISKPLVTVTLNTCKISSLINMSGGIRIRWNKVANATGYMVYRKKANASKYTRIKVLTGSAATTYIDTSVRRRNGTEYIYYVSAFYGDSANPEAVSSYTAKKTRRLTTPKLRRVRAITSKTAKAIWRKNKKVTSYQIQIAKNKTFTKGKRTITIKGSKKTSYVIRRLTKGKKYIRIRGCYKSGKTRYYSAWSKAKILKIK